MHPLCSLHLANAVTLGAGPGHDHSRPEDRRIRRKRRFAQCARATEWLIMVFTDQAPLRDFQHATKIARLIARDASWTASAQDLGVSPPPDGQVMAKMEACRDCRIDPAVTLGFTTLPPPVRPGLEETDRIVAEGPMALGMIIF